MKTENTKERTDILEQLAAARLQDALESEMKVPFAEMLERAAIAPAPRDFAAAFSGSGTRIIAELKRASPSEGNIRTAFEPAALARELEDAGAAALSVLCEPHRFLGSMDFLREARGATRLPVLCKDFISSRYQIAEARAAGADAVLLIAAVLDPGALSSLAAFARSLGMEALVEAHDAREIAVAADCGARIVGVNCRDLRNFETDVSLLESLVPLIPRPLVRIAESGMHSRRAVERAKTAGADGFLVGTALMRAQRPGLKLHELAGTPA